MTRIKAIILIEENWFFNREKQAHSMRSVIKSGAGF